MKKRGFTLIELLAVIVVLAIIALIATPIVMNTIKRSKKGAAERSADSYVKQVEVAVAEERLSKNEVLEGEYQITSDGNLCRDKSASCSDDKKIKIEMNGTKPTSGKIKITNGSVDQSSSNMTIGDYDVTYNSTKKTYEATEKGSTPQVEVLCTANTTKASASVLGTIQEVGLLASESGAYTPGVAYTCELGDNEAKTFFVLETNGDNVSLIAGFNLGDPAAWISKEDYIDAGGEDLSNDGGACQYGGMCAKNEYGPITAKKYIKNSTTSWAKLTESQINLPSANQIATASGKTVDENSSDPCYLSLWLYGNLTGASSAYWTSTPRVSDSSSALLVHSSGNFDYQASIESNVGVRPVITVSKAQLG